MSPDAAEVQFFLQRVGRRLAWLSAAEGAAAGFALAIALTVVVVPSRGPTRELIIGGLALVALGVIMRMLMTGRRRRPVAQLVEERAPRCLNVVITADELLTSGSATPEYVRLLVWRDAARAVRALDPTALFPAGRTSAILAAAALLWIIALVRTANPALASMPSALRRANATAAGIQEVDVTITPPAYTGRPDQTVRDPARVEALVGSQLRLSIHSHGGAVTVETLTGSRELRPVATDSFVADLPADADGYIGLQVTPANGHAEAHRLIGLSVTPDNAPRVRITVPAKDITLTDAHASLDIGAEATDDIGLATLQLRYTKVSGSGERFTFSEGTVPLEIVRHDARSWSGHVHWPLDGLALTPGDMVVYRAQATDHRPGAPASESDSFIAELAAPGGDAAAGFSLDPDEQRYAVSQQMVIIKSERLLARKPALAADDYTSQAQDIAAEQRKVRAEFVFMMGGEVADAPDPNSDMTSLNETAEAEGESDLAGGRLFNQGRVALQNGIRAMSRATTSLTAGDVSAALPHEREALAQLEQAFSRSRIILRALTEHEQLDLTRRLSGTLTDVTRDILPSANPAADPRTTALRRSLAAIASLSAATPLDRAGSARASLLAEQLLQVDASDTSLQAVAALLDSAATSLGAGGQKAHDELDRAAIGLAATVRRGMLNAPAAPANLTTNRLGGALTDALRHPAGRP